MTRFSLASVVAAVSLAASASPATASVTIGQLAPGSSPPSNCNAPGDIFNPTTGGNSYVIPGTGTITSWSTNAGGNLGQMLKMKIFRKVADPMDYTVVGHDLRALTAGTINTFPVSIPVQAGDVLGLNDANASTVNNACDFFASPATRLGLPGDLADNDRATFGNDAANLRVNVSAVFETATGQRAAALASCKKRAHKHHWSHKRLKKCRKKANLLPL